MTPATAPAVTELVCNYTSPRVSDLTILCIRACNVNSFVISRSNIDKMLSYRRETALQGAL